jgi:hypothetical protein
MRLSSFVRALSTASSVVLLWAVSVSPALAAPALAVPAPVRGATGPVCEADAVPVPKLPRHPKSFGGPLKQPTPLQFGLSDPTARMRRGARTSFDGDDAAIQNDAPAAHVDEHGQPVPSLLLVGVLPHAVVSRPRSPTASPRSPRGPPQAA